MHLLITGGGGFVMAHVASRWLDVSGEATVTILDASPLSPLVADYFAADLARIDYRVGDVRDPEAWASLPSRTRCVVHGAAVTPHAGRSPDGTWMFPERDRPADVVSVNIDGLVQALEWSRNLPDLCRFVNVSSGSVYARDRPAGTEGGPIGEGEWVVPDELYDITKYTGELLCRRYKRLFNLPLLSVRLSTVYGPLDRITATRSVDCLPKILIQSAISGKTIRVRDLDAVGDYISASDVADAIVGLLRCEPSNLLHDTYNVARGRADTVRELVEQVERLVGPLSIEVASDSDGEMDATLTAAMGSGREGAYDIARIQQAIGWQPQSFAARLEEYAEWIRAHSPSQPIHK